MAIFVTFAPPDLVKIIYFVAVPSLQYPRIEFELLSVNKGILLPAIIGFINGRETRNFIIQ